MSATHDSSFNFKVNTTGSGNESTDAKSISDGQHLVVLAWNYDQLPASGSITYSKDGASAVSAGAPVQVRSRSGNSDRAAAWIVRNPGAGSYVINSVGLDYVGLSAHVFNAKPNFWIRASSGAAGEGTGTTFTSGSVTPRFTSSIAYGYWTHNSHAGTAAMTVPGGWTLSAGPNTVVHKAENYGGASQPGGCAYRNITDSGDPKTPITFAPTCSDNNNYLSLILLISEPDTEYLVMGGTTVTAASPPNQGWFGHDGAGGADGTDRVTFAQDITTDDGVRTIGAPVLAGQLLIPVMGLYGGDAETTDYTVDGASNTILKDVQAAWGSGSPASATCFSCLTVSNCDYIEYNGPGSGSNKRYGQHGCYVSERPDPLTYRSVTGVARVVNTSSATIDPGGVTPLVPNTTLCFVIFVATNQGHSVDLLPLVYDDVNFVPALCHSQLNKDEGVPDANTTGATHNSDHSSGWWLGRVYTAGTSYAPTVTFQTTSGYHRAVLMAYNLSGGSPVGGKATKSRRTHPLGMALGMRRMGR
jgi:hypothetical protein